MYTQVQVYQLALKHLGRNLEITSETDESREVNIFRANWPFALELTLSDLKLEATSLEERLLFLQELDPPTPWQYAYRYPINCLFFKRLTSGFKEDNRSTLVSKRIKLVNYNDELVKSILTNQKNPVAEYIPNNAPFLQILSTPAVMALSYRLAVLSVNNIIGEIKNRHEVEKKLESSYIIEKAQAMEIDELENKDSTSDVFKSEFVEAKFSGP